MLPGVGSNNTDVNGTMFTATWNESMGMLIACVMKSGTVIDASKLSDPNATCSIR